MKEVYTMMNTVMDYVKPELIVVAVVLYFIGIAIKQSQAIKDKYITVIIGAIGIVLALIWVLATSSIETWQNVLLALFTAIVQGVLVAGLSTYVDQLIKQGKKSE